MTLYWMPLRKQRASGLDNPYPWSGGCRCTQGTEFMVEMSQLSWKWKDSSTQMSTGKWDSVHRKKMCVQSVWHNMLTEEGSRGGKGLLPCSAPQPHPALSWTLLQGILYCHKTSPAPLSQTVCVSLRFWMRAGEFMPCDSSLQHSHHFNLLSCLIT